MNENPQPEVNNENPATSYRNIKYPLIRRRIRVPAAMEDYIGSLMELERLSDAEIEEIRKEMKASLTVNGADVPEDFDRHFNQWFLIEEVEADTQDVSEADIETDTEDVSPQTDVSDPLPEPNKPVLTAENSILDFQNAYGCSYERARQLWTEAGGKQHKDAEDAELRQHARHLHEEAKLTLQEIADKLGKDKSTISRWLSAPVA